MQRHFFYEEIEQMVENMPHSDLKIIIGDANVEIRREEMYVAKQYQQKYAERHVANTKTKMKQIK